MSGKHWAQFLAYRKSLKIISYFHCKVTWLNQENNFDFVAKPKAKQSDLGSY